MHYYKRNIGDYHKKAGRLSVLEHGAYTLLIDACYDREHFPTKEQAIEWCWARTPEEIAAVCFVLSRFFTLDCNIYYQARIQDELDAYHENAITNKRIAIEREENRRNKKNETSTNRVRTVNEPPPNQEPRTINQEPITNIQPGAVAPIVKGKFIKPSIAELANEFRDRVPVCMHSALAFLNHYESNGWKVGRSPMKSWKHAVTNWITRGSENANSGRGYQSKSERADEAVREAIRNILPQ